MAFCSEDDSEVCWMCHVKVIGIMRLTWSYCLCTLVSTSTHTQLSFSLFCLSITYISSLFSLNILHRNTDVGTHLYDLSSTSTGCHLLDRCLRCRLVFIRHPHTKGPSSKRLRTPTSKASRMWAYCKPPHLIWTRSVPVWQILHSACAGVLISLRVQ